MRALEIALFGRSAWTRRQLEEELRGPARYYIVAEEHSTPGEALGRLGDAVNESGESTAALGELAGRSGEPVIVGFGGVFCGDQASIMTVDVVSDHQRRGIGRLIVEDLLAAAQAAGCREVLLEVRTDNVPAIALYESLGFSTIGIRRRYYQPEDADAHTMHRSLSPHP